MISKRIKKIASLVDKGVNVIDIGCDHGLTDIYLTLHNKNKCIATDINQKALNNAINNFKKNNLEIETILSNGFDKININDNTTCIITGMGTSTIINILNNKKSNLVDTYIIQTNNDYYSLRKYMVKKGYFIMDEIAFIDKKVPYIIIKFKKGKKIYSNKSLKLGPIIIKKRDEDTLLYLKTYLKEKEEILKKLPKKYIFKKYILNKNIKKIKKILG